MNPIRYMLVALLISLATVQAQTTPADIFNFPELDFDTPEAAIYHFVESVSKNDLTATLQAFATNAYAEHFDFTAQTKRMGVISPFQTLAPTEYPMYAQINHLNLLRKYALDIQFFCYSFYSTEPVDGTTIRIEEDESERVDAFIASINPEQLANLTVTQMFRINALSGKMQEVWQQQAEPVGAEEITEFVVLYELNGDYFMGGFHLLRYGEFWKIDGLSSILAGMDAMETVSRIIPEDFAAFISELGSNDNWTLEEIPQ
jgi:hypothetical protein